MSKPELYDDFGNYIGDDLDSGDEDDILDDQFISQQKPTHAPLEGYDDQEEAEQKSDSGLMDVDERMWLIWVLRAHWIFFFRSHSFETRMLSPYYSTTA